MVHDCQADPPASVVPKVPGDEPVGPLARLFDAVVTICDCTEGECSASRAWHLTLPSELPHIVVKPALSEEEYRIVPAEAGSPTMILVHAAPGRLQARLVNRALCELYVIRPLLFVSSLRQVPTMEQRWAPVTVFVATESTCAQWMNASPGEDTGLCAVSKRADILLTPTPLAGLDSGSCWRLVLPNLASRVNGSALLARWNALGEEWKQLTSCIAEVATCRSTASGRLNVLVLHDDRPTFINTVREYLESFGQFSRHSVCYATATNDIAAPLDLGLFDAVLLHYSVRLYLGKHLSPHYQKALQEYGGFKAVFLQDEYDLPREATRWIRTLGIHHVFTCVPPRFVDRFYPRATLPHVRTRTVLTGYVPLRFEERHRLRPMGERKWSIGYRGRTLPACYGALAREKLTIGMRMKEICQRAGVAANIEWDDSKRLYGEAWYDFIEDCKATLGTESGSNVLDVDGTMRAALAEALERDPHLSYEQVWERYVKPFDHQVQMNQVSPRIFEAIALGTALILFEGDYSGVVEPDVHFIPLKKDFSNADDVLERLRDDAYLTGLVTRAHHDVIESGRYSYRAFVSEIDRCLEEEVTRPRGYHLVTAPVGWRDPFDGGLRFVPPGFHRGHPTRDLLYRVRDPYGEHTPLPVFKEEC